MTAGSAMRFEFASATRIVFGSGSATQAGEAAAAFGNYAILVTGADPARSAPIQDSLRSSGVVFETLSVFGEPTVDWLRTARAERNARSIQVVVGCGGGSAIDAGKALAAMLANPGDPLDYLEVIGRGQPLRNRSVPFIAIPTTSGTGAEVTRNAVLGSPEHGVKASLRSAGMLPHLAMVDPELTVPLPATITATTGLDALTQLIEPFVCTKANPMTDALCREGIPRVARSLRAACENGSDLYARTEMALASLLSGLALANAGLGAVHGFAAPIGGYYQAPHGAVCAALLPHAMRANLRALSEKAPHSPALARYGEVAHMLTGDPAATSADGIDWVEQLTSHLNVPPLSRWGVGRDRVDILCERAANANSMKANPVQLTHAELAACLEAALG